MPTVFLCEVLQQRYPLAGAPRASATYLSPPAPLNDDFRPLTLPCSAGLGATVQIFSFRNQHMVAAVQSPAQRLQLMDGSRISNGLFTSQQPAALMRQLSALPPREWSVVLDAKNGHVQLWPKMVASAADQPDHQPYEGQAATDAKSRYEASLPRIVASLQRHEDFHLWLFRACDTGSEALYEACKKAWFAQSTTCYTARKTFKNALNHPMSKMVEMTLPGADKKTWLGKYQFQSDDRPVHLATVARTGHLALAKRLLANGADANPSEWTTLGYFRLSFKYPLAEALKAGHKTLVDLLLSEGAKPENPFIYQVGR